MRANLGARRRTGPTATRTATRKPVRDVARATKTPRDSPSDERRLLTAFPPQPEPVLLVGTDRLRRCDAREHRAVRQDRRAPFLSALDEARRVACPPGEY